MTKPISTSFIYSAWRYRGASLAIVGGLALAGCSGSIVESLTPRLGGATYAGDIQPTVARVPDRQAGASTITADQGFAPDQSGAASESAAASDAIAPGTPPATVTGAPAPTAPAPTTPPPQPAPTSPPASRTIASTAAPPATAPAPEPGPVEDQLPSAPVATVATGTPPAAEERPQTFPNLADVPDAPQDLPSQETLDAEREALAAGEPPPSPSAEPSSTSTAPQGGGATSGSLLGSLRERLASQQPSGPSVLYFEVGSAELPSGAGIAGIAERWRESDGEIRVVGFARILQEGGRAAALGTALQRANAVAAALVNAGVPASEISVFANAVEGEEDDRRTRRVDIFIE